MYRDYEVYKETGKLPPVSALKPEAMQHTDTLTGMYVVKKPGEFAQSAPGEQLTP